MSKFIAFDVDGTILNSWPVFEQEMVKYASEQNMPMPCLDSIRHGYAFPHEVDFKWGLELHEQKPHLHNVYRRIDEHVAGVIPPMYDGALEFLQALKKRGYTLGIVTSKPSEPMAAVLKHYDLEPVFCGVRTSCDVRLRKEREKPAPDQLLSLAKELSFTPEQTVMIGDTTMDIHMGLAAGAHTIGVTWGNHDAPRLTEAGAHNIASRDYDEVMSYIINLS